jgi:hypothetical protein
MFKIPEVGAQDGPTLFTLSLRDPGGRHAASHADPQSETRECARHRGAGGRQHRDRPLTRAILRRHPARHNPAVAPSDSRCGGGHPRHAQDPWIEHAHPLVVSDGGCVLLLRGRGLLRVLGGRGEDGEIGRPLVEDGGDVLPPLDCQ